MKKVTIVFEKEVPSAILDLFGNEGVVSFNIQEHVSHEEFNNHVTSFLMEHPEVTYEAAEQFTEIYYYKD